MSLLAGCHADEPVGPRLLRRVVDDLLAGPDGEELRGRATWFVIADINPDGAAANAAWQPPDAERYDFADWLRHRVRELPGDDIGIRLPARGD